MTELNSETAGAAILAVATAQLGKGYSEQSPAGSDGDGHLWVPGKPYGNVFDCSGLVRTSCIANGLNVSDGNAQDQWLQHLGGIVPVSEPLKPGDIGSFMGSDNIPGYAGHTGIVQTFDPLTGYGTMVNAYDTAMGVCVTTFQRNPTGNSNGLGVIGFYRPAASLPAPKPTPPAPGSPASKVPIKFRNACPTPLPTLTPGRTNSRAAVVYWRLCLRAAGFWPRLVPCVGWFFGPLTQRQTRKFKTSRTPPLVDDAIVGAECWAKVGAE